MQVNTAGVDQATVIEGYQYASGAMSQERRIRTGVVGLMMLASALVGAVVEAQMDGVRDYRTYCAVCHGTEGRGDGPLANGLTRRPADLTQLSIRNGGSFPETLVYQIIDGRRIVLFHGTREMPIWGDRFATHSDDAAVADRISALVGYVERIQSK